MKEEDARVQDIRVSRIWVETFTGPAVPDGGMLGCLDDPGEYARRFDGLRPGMADADGLQLPWLHRKERYWLHYAHLRTLKAMKGECARAHLVPFRAKPVFRLSGPWPGGHMSAEVYLYPHGMACVAGARIVGDFTLEEAASQVACVKSDQFSAVKSDQFSAGPGGGTMSLHDMALRTFDEYRKQMLGDNAGAGSGWNEPFTLVTVVRGRAQAGSPQSGGPVHRFLDWAAQLSVDKDPEPLDDHRINRTGSRRGFLYGYRNTRVIWHPKRFSHGTGLHSLSCYHRNLLFCSLQVESLGRYLYAAHQHLKKERYLPPGMKVYARGVIENLQRIFEGDVEETYRSWSPRRQMEDKKLDAKIQAVRQYLDDVC